MNTVAILQHDNGRREIIEIVTERPEHNRCLLERISRDNQVYVEQRSGKHATRSPMSVYRFKK